MTTDASRTMIRRDAPRCQYEFTGGAFYQRCVLNDGHATQHHYDVAGDWQWWTA